MALYKEDAEMVFSTHDPASFDLELLTDENGSPLFTPNEIDDLRGHWDECFDDYDEGFSYGPDMDEGALDDLYLCREAWSEREVE